MLGKRKALWLIASLPFIFGCAAMKVQIKILKPAEISLRGIKKIAIVDFQGPERSGSQAATHLMGKLFETGRFKIMERDKITRIMTEHQFSMTGIADASTATEAGRILGVDALILGEVTAYETEDKEGKEKVKEMVWTGRHETYWETKGGKKVKKQRPLMQPVYVDRYYTIRTGTVSINYRVVRIETGSVMAVKMVSRSYDSGAVYDSGKLEPNGRILSDLLDAVTDVFARQIAPYYVIEQRIVESGKTAPMKSGANFMKAELREEAQQAFEEAVELEPANPGAHYNLGLSYEIRGDFDPAEDEYKKAFSLKQKTLYLEAIKRIHRRIEEQEKLNEQL